MHPLMVCQGGSMDSKISMSKDGPLVLPGWMEDGWMPGACGVGVPVGNRRHFLECRGFEEEDWVGIRMEGKRRGKMSLNTVWRGTRQTVRTQRLTARQRDVAERERGDAVLAVDQVVLVP